MVESAESSASPIPEESSSPADIVDDENKHLLFGEKNMRLSEELVPFKQLDIIKQNHHPECARTLLRNTKEQECFHYQEQDQEGGNCKRPHGRIFIYMQILHIR